MKIVVFGLGHVGVVTVAALLKAGHIVIGADLNEGIRNCLARGLSPLREPEVADLIAAGHAAGRLSVTANVADGIDADLVFVCVGTRGSADGAFDLSDVAAAARDLGEAVRRRSPTMPPIVLAFRSTMLPGTMSETVLPMIVAAAGEAPGVRYEVVYNPEFSREGSAIADYFSPARIIVGERQPGSARVLLDLFGGIDAPIFTTSFAVAELTKLADNSFHALKVAFANEIGRFALQSGISPSEVFDLFQVDTKLNLSASYLRLPAPFAAEGMGLRHEENILVADSPDEMTDQIVRLYSDAELWQRLSSNGYQAFQDRFSLTSGAGKVLAVVDGLLAAQAEDRR